MEVSDFPHVVFNRPMGLCIPYLTFPLLMHYTEVLHASLLKVSEKNANAPLRLEQANFSEIAKQTGVFLQQIPSLSPYPVCWVRQCHGTHIVCVNSQGEQIEAADAMITQQPALSLMVLHADCQALLFYDPVQKVIAAAHVGWRGSANNLPARVIEKMHSHFGVIPHNVHVTISPSIGPVHAHYPNYTEHFPKEMWKYQSKAGYFNFWNLTHDQLCTVGVLSSRISSAQLCTFAHPSLLFSHRRDGPKAGRHGTAIVLRA